jgi:hypothetical protein
MVGADAGYAVRMTEHARGPGSPEPGLEDEHTRIADKRGFTGEPQIEGLPDEEDVEGTDVDERLDEKPEETPNRRDVPEA